MAKYNQGLLGQFSGKAGPVVGSSWKGIGYLRGNPRKTRNRDASMKTEIQTAKFKLASSFVKAIASLLAITFPGSKTKTTGRNNALSSVLQQAITGDYPDLRIEYSKVHNYEKSYEFADRIRREVNQPGKGITCYILSLALLGKKEEARHRLEQLLRREDDPGVTLHGDLAVCHAALGNLDKTFCYI